MGIGDIKGIFIGIIIGLIVLGSGSFILGSFFSYDSSIDPTNIVSKTDSMYLNASSGMSSSVDKLNNSLSKLATTKPGSLGFFNALLGSVTNTLTTVGSSLGFLNVMLYQMSTILHIPTFIIGLLLAIVVVVVVFSIIAAIMQVND